MSANEPQRGGARRGSVLVIVMVTLLFAASALLLFIERASNDLLVEVREADAARLRLEAYSALETTIAVLDTFREVGGGLRTPAEGWDDPLRWSDYEPAAGRRVQISFEDESAKLSLPRLDFDALANLFRTIGVAEPEVEPLADALLGWVQEDYTPRSALAPRAEDYAREPLPHEPPGRPLRSFQELRAVARVRDLFFDEVGRPTDLGRRFMAAVSLFDFAAPNINAASGAVLAARGGYDPAQIALLEDYRAGRGAYTGRGGFFRDAAEVETLIGGNGATGTGAFATQIQALRINVTVQQGQSFYQLSAVVAPPGGARAVAPAALPEDEMAPRAAPAPAAAGQNPASASPAGAANSLNYPFTLLEIRENDAGPAVEAAPDVTL